MLLKGVFIVCWLPVFSKKTTTIDWRHLDPFHTYFPHVIEGVTPDHKFHRPDNLSPGRSMEFAMPTV